MSELSPSARDFIDAFVVACRDTFAVQVSTEVSFSQARSKIAEDSKNISVAGVVSIVCNGFRGSICLSFPDETFLRVYQAMVGEDHAAINDEILDAAGEILNIIYGNAKTYLIEKKGYALKPVIPHALRGKDLKISYRSPAKAMIVPVTSRLGPFHLEFIYEE